MKCLMTMLAAALLLLTAMQTAMAAAPAPGPGAAPPTYATGGQAVKNDADVAEAEDKELDRCDYAGDDEDYYKAYPDEGLEEDAPVDVRDCWSCH